MEKFYTNINVRRDSYIVFPSNYVLPRLYTGIDILFLYFYTVFFIYLKHLSLAVAMVAAGYSSLSNAMPLGQKDRQRHLGFTGASRLLPGNSFLCAL